MELTPGVLIGTAQAAPQLRLPLRTAWRSLHLVIAPILAGGVVAAILQFAARSDPLHAPAWNHAIGLVAGIAGFVAVLRGAWLAEDRLERRVRTQLAAAAALVSLSQLTHLAAAIAERSTPAFLDAIPLAGIVLVLVGCWWTCLAGRFSRAEQIAVVLDSAVVFCTLGAGSLVLLGGQSSDGGTAALAFTVMAAAAIGATVILNLAITPRRTVGGWLAIVAGSVPLVAGYAWEAAGGAATGAPYALLQASGILVCSYGAATWVGEPDPSNTFRTLATSVRSWLPMAAVAGAPILVVANELLLSEHGNRMGGLVADSMLALVLMLCVVRQTMLLRDRDENAGEARRAAERAGRLMHDLVESEQRFRSLVTNSSDVFLIIRPDGTVSYQSPAVERVLGYPPDDRLGRQIFELTHPDDIGFVQATIRDLIATPNGQHTIELRTRHADGSWRTLEATGRNMTDDPSVGGLVVNYRDVTERKRLEQQLTHQAFHDPLTGLANRALFVDRVNHAAQRRAGEGEVSVLFMDLDDFKTINDSLGHVAGDIVLRSVSERLLACLRPEDTMARLGGDEFAILLEDGGEQGARMVSQRVLGALEPPFEIGGRQVRIGASIGVAVGGADADDLLRNADVAMYTAKSHGKGRVELFEAAMHAAAVTRLELRADLEHALERGELRLRYQPVFDLATGSLESFEALLRWRHPARGEVMPADFVPLAEETGLIVSIGRWVLNQACVQAQAWRDAGHPELSVSVNVSPRQLAEPGVISWVADALAASGLPAVHLVLELTESGIMQDDEGVLGALRELGVRLALDDFGTGYSSLSYLARFPIDVLKIDRSFIAELGADGEDPALVRSVIQLASAMKLRTVAEGIERPEQLERVKALGCDFGQGFLLARPMHAIAATALVTGDAGTRIAVDDGNDASAAGDAPEIAESAG